MPQDSYYDDATDSSAPAQAAEPMPEEGGEKTKDKTPEAKLGLVPMSFFNEPVRPGDREMVEVVDVYENEVSIKCIYGEDEEKAEGEAPEPGAAPAPAAQDEMMM